LCLARAGEETRGHRADEDRDGDGQEDPGRRQDEGDRIDLHDRPMFRPPAAAGVGPKVTSTMGRRRFLAAAGVVLAAACAPEAASPRRAADATFVPPLGADPARGIWPTVYHGAPAEVREAYAWAVAHEESLRFIPCYCGCAADGHTSNYSCYVRSRTAAGWVILDTHGFG